MDWQTAEMEFGRAVTLTLHANPPAPAPPEQPLGALSRQGPVCEQNCHTAHSTAHNTPLVLLICFEMRPVLVASYNRLQKRKTSSQSDWLLALLNPTTRRGVFQTDYAERVARHMQGAFDHGLEGPACWK
eukprot:scaffold207651_cov18-Tisochrysis_lutea.AAC.1